jgi:hypothetical protein
MEQQTGSTFPLGVNSFISHKDRMNRIVFNYVSFINENAYIVYLVSQPNVNKREKWTARGVDNITTLTLYTCRKHKLHIKL